MSAPWSRRSLLAALACAGAGVLSGCEQHSGEKVQVGPTDAAGRLIPAQAADTTLLLAVLERTRELITLGRDLGPGPQSVLLRETQIAHVQQAEVLTRLLQAAGIGPGALTRPPGEGAAATSRPDSGQTSAPVPDDAGQGATATAGPAPPRPQRLATLVASLPGEVSRERLRPLAGASAANLPTLISLHGERAAAALLLEAPITWPPLTGPTGARTVGLLAALRPAVYVLEVTSARAATTERERYERALAPLRGLTRQVTELAGAAAPAAPLGYGLPEPLSTAKQRAALVTRALRPLPAAVVAGTASLTGDLPGISGSVRLLGEVISVGHPFGIPLTGFPGMSVP